MEAAEVPAVAELYAKYTAIGAGKITGMLLERDIPYLETLVSDEEKLSEAIQEAVDVIMAKEDKKNNKTSTPAPAPAPKPEDPYAEIARLRAQIGFLEYRLGVEMHGRISAERQTQDALSVVRLMASSKLPQG
jgi:hypothetical protein